MCVCVCEREREREREHTLLLSSTARCSRVILCLSCPSLRFSHFCKEHRFLLLENGIRNQKEGARSPHYYWDVIASMPREVIFITDLFLKEQTCDMVKGPPNLKLLFGALACTPPCQCVCECRQAISPVRLSFFCHI